MVREWHGRYLRQARRGESRDEAGVSGTPELYPIFLAYADGATIRGASK